MHSFLNITRHPYEEPHHVNLVVHAGNASTQGKFEIYANASDLGDAATALSGFPTNRDDSFVWQLGSDDKKDRFAFHFRLRVFQISPAGRCGIEIRFNNNQQPPDQQIVAFCIEAEPADIDRLGRMFDCFSRLDDLTMQWSVDSET